MIRCKDISKKYKKESVITKTNLRIRTNKISFLMGANGTGKTTFIKCMMGLEKCEGQFIFGSNSLDDIKDQCLVIWDDCPFYTNLSGLKNLLLFSESKKTKEEIIKIAMMYMDKDLLNRKVKTYSYGQKKKLALILIEVLQPKYLVLDEISNGLDYDTMKILQKQIKLWAKHMTIFLTGHQFGFYNDLIDDLYVFENKQIKFLKENFSKENVRLEDVYDYQSG